ncbi:MAG: universal stress protein [Thaumarchaeota archaeon]|nr:universal stress protein [Nitrososphaerota archaeon]
MSKGKTEGSSGIILVAIDGSPNSDKVVKTAGSVAKNMGSSALLLHVIPKLEVPPEVVEYARVEKVSDPYQMLMKSIADSILDKFGKQLADMGVKTERLTEVGHPPDVITMVAKERKASLIVVGFIGLRGVGRVRALGSVSRRVLENASCPVLVVPT